MAYPSSSQPYNVYTSHAPSSGGGHLSLGLGIPDPSTTRNIGSGTVHDPNGIQPRQGVADNGNAAWGSGPPRTHYRLTRHEILQGVANRFVHSTAYLYFYGGMAVVSLLTVALSLLQDCPGVLFYALELAINVVLIAEVAIRMAAFGKQFWKSTFNIVDMCLVLLCALTLAIIFFSHDCSPYRRDSPPSSTPGRGGKSEELLDSFLLIFRNAVQCVRLLSVVRRSGSSVTNRVGDIDINGVRGAAGGSGADGGHGRGFSLDIDLEDEEAGYRARMADGGDPGMRGWKGGRGGATEDRRALFDVQEDDDDEEL